MSPRTGDPLTDALNIAAALVWSKQITPYRGVVHDGEDRVQDFQLWVLEKWRFYNPEQGAVSTFVYMLFRQWGQLRQAQRADRRNHDMLFDPQIAVDFTPHYAERLVLELEAPPLVEERHELSPEVRRYIDDLPEKIRGPVETHVAYGASLTATAEIHGITDRSVSRYVKQAKEIWRNAA